MSEYAGTVAPGLLTESRYEQHPTAIYDLRSKRLGITSETGEGKPLNETLTKRLTGILRWCAENDQKPNSLKWLGPRIQRKGCEKRL